MVLEEVIEVFYRLLEITTLVKNLFGDFDQTAVFVGDNSSSSGHVIDQRYFSKRVSGVVIDAFFSTFVFLVLALNTIDSFKYDVEVLPAVSFFEDYLMHLVVF
jgi:hypothetical protein